MILYGYDQSSATYRVRIVLNLKGLGRSDELVDLLSDDQSGDAYRAVNPQGLVPTLETAQGGLTQSLAICEYLDEVWPDPPLLPADPFARAQVRAFAQVIACDVHPLQNLKILRRLRASGLDREQVLAWACTTIAEGLETCEALAARHTGPFCLGEAVTLADVFLVPQLANARRFGVEGAWPRLLAIEARCLALDAFRDAAPKAA